VLREAVRRAVVDDGVRTRDLGGEASTQDVTRAIIRRIG
jgi:isocitrate/isopropylmalate dehydrogenase